MVAHASGAGHWRSGLDLDSHSPAAGPVAGGSNPQTSVLAPQDRFGDIGASVEIATYMSAKSVNNAEVFDRRHLHLPPLIRIDRPGNSCLDATVQRAAGGDVRHQVSEVQLFRHANLAGNTGQPAISRFGSIG